jgi:outer membrane protein assembly factor BamE (lipoprotein component of BamABCDE complex)
MMSVMSIRLGLAAAIGLAAFSVGGCTAMRGHQGYIIDVDLVNSVKPGVDNRQSVLGTLGKPSFTSQFKEGDWYYIARDTKNLAYRNPKVTQQTTLRVSFDPQGNVASITRTGAEQIVSLHPYKKTTPTLGRSRGFFAEVFGNIGTVGAGGVGGSPDSGSGGGGRDTP